MKPLCVCIGLGILLQQIALSQAGPAKLTFAVADVHPSAPGTKEDGGFLPEGRLEYRGTTLLQFISEAYSLRIDQIQGGPDWLASDRFDLTARAPSRTATLAEMRAMIQSLLADRFNLVVHNEPRAMPVYLLQVSGKGAKLAQTADPADPDCPAVDGDALLLHRACHAFSMADLSALLPQIARNYIDRPMVDATGLTGRYDFPLDWMSKAAYLDATAIGRPAVSMQDALDKLGLQLEPGTRPASVLVIDRVDRTPKPANPPIPTEFEVAHIRPSRSPARKESLRALPDGQLELTSYTLRDLMSMAFDVKRDRIKGGPKWVDTERFDVVAKSPEVMSPRAMHGMLQALIVRRFKMATHNESQPVNVFALITGSAAPKLAVSNGVDRSECKLTLEQKGRIYACRNSTMAQFTERLPDVTQAYLTDPLVDLTGLPGAYDFALTWTPKDRLPRVALPNSAPTEPDGAVAQASTPTGDVTLFEAIDKQLGLKLEERKHPMPVIVIDRVSRTPEENL